MSDTDEKFAECFIENASNHMHPILAEAAILLRKKSMDYNNDPNPDPARREYFPFGHHSYLHMLHTKFERLKAVCLSDEANPNFESARDSCLDLINYAAFYAAYLDSLQVEEEKE